MLSDAIVAQATPPGRSAVALLRLSGTGSHDLAATVLDPFAARPYRHARLSTLRNPRSTEAMDQVLYVAYDQPRSYTGEDVVEITTHGGLQVPTDCLAALLEAGARLAEPGEFTRRALKNGKMDLLQVEAIGDLIDATAPAQRRAAIDQLDRGLSRRISEIRAQVLELEGLVAYDIDFPEEDHGPVPPARVKKATDGVKRGLSEMLTSAVEGERLKEGALVVIGGLPNAGKSSLFNALLGKERAIVTEVPGTTRDAIEAPASCGGFPFRLVDTAGLRDTADAVERVGVEFSWRFLDAADLVLFCAEAGRSLGEEEEQFLARVEVPSVVVRTKSDLAPGSSEDGLHVSAHTGAGLAALREEMARLAFTTLAARGDVGAVLTRERHRIAITNALDELAHFSRAGAEGLEMAVAATHLRAAVTKLDDVIGAVAPDDVLEEVFRSFCVGK